MAPIERWNQLQEEIENFRKSTNIQLSNVLTEKENLGKVIERFDNVILDKASKISIEEVHKKLESYITTNDMSKFHLKMVEEIQKVRKYSEEIDLKQENIQNEVIIKTKESVAMLVHKIK